MTDATAPSETVIEAVSKRALAPFVPKRRKLMDITTMTAISFSLTFVVVSLLLLTGVIPASFATLTAPVDIGVLLLIVPLCALVLAMVAEVLRAAMKGTPQRHNARSARRKSFTDWRPGRGEG
ncbi:MAG TPA: hypothetical protein PK286_09680 [Devosia sp.]|nr:hypothetical protein [Devosia sp.]